MKYTKAIVPLIGLFLLVGCQLPPNKQKASGKEMVAVLKEGVKDNTFLEKKSNTQALPENVKAALRPSLQSIQGRGLSAPDKQFDLFVEQVPARTFFLSLVEGTGYNITVHPEVDGKISLQLKKVTIPEVLETVRNVYGYDFKQTPQGIEVLPATLQTRAFSVNYLDINRGGQSETQVSAGTLKSSSGQGTSGTSGSSTGGSSTSSTTGGQQSLVVNSKVTTSNKTNFWTELKTAVETIIGTGEGRQVAVSPMSSLLVVQAMPNELKRVADFLKSADLALNRQVILEAKILEVELNDSFQAGINWSLVSGRINSTQFGGNVIAKPLNAGDTFPVLNSNLSSMSIAQGQVTRGAPAASAGVFGGAFALSTNFKNLSSFIEVLGAQGKVHVLSSPSISTLNNQKALFKVGSDKFYVTNVSTTTTSSTNSTQTSPSVTFDSFFSGIALDVTPNITNGDEITLHIHPTISNVQDDIKTLPITDSQGNIQQQAYPLAKSTVRESDSMVKAKSGQMIIIGGLMQNQTSDLKEGIPVLKDLPVFGNLFRHTVQVTKKSELVILLKPTVVHNDTWSEAVDNNLNRFSKMNEEIAKDENRFHCKGPNCRQ